VGAKGSSSVAPISSLFHTEWGKDTYHQKMNDLYNMPTPGQQAAIISEILALEKGMIGKSNSNMDRAAFEYEDTMQSIELYENLVQEGKGK